MSFSYELMQSALRTSLASALESADVLVTAVFGVGGWAFIRFLDNVNQRFNAVDRPGRDVATSASTLWTSA